MQDDPASLTEAKVARSMGRTIEEWDALGEYERSWAMAPDLAEAQAASERCEACGRDKAECQNPDNQHAYVVTFRRCYRTAAIIAAQKARAAKSGDMDGVLTVVTLDPSKKKSAQRRG